MAATRILGCMNFACFLPPDTTLRPITAQGKLLSARDANAQIPVYTTKEGYAKLDTIDGSKLGCYAVIGQDPEQGTPTRYQIQFAGTSGWVPRWVTW